MQLRGNQLLRGIDALVGRFLVWGWALFKRKRDFPEKIESIGLLKLSGIGDLVLLSGVIQDLRRVYPHAKLILFCGANNIALAELIPALDQIILVPLQRPFKALALMRKHRPTVMIDFGQWSFVDPLLAHGSGCMYTIGFKTGGQHRQYLYDAAQSHSAKVHEMENFRSLVKLMGVESSALPTLQVNPISNSQLFPDGKYILFHPWPSGLQSHLKEWPLASWIQLGTELVARGYTIILSGGREDSARSQALKSQLDRKVETDCVVDIAGKYSLNELGHCIRAAAGVVSVNTGIMHIAACFPVPLIALHGPTSAKRWGPIGEHATALEPSCASCGYLHLGFEYPKNPPRCMEAISVEQVLEALSFRGL